jgi:hypothetical protein
MSVVLGNDSCDPIGTDATCNIVDITHVAGVPVSDLIQVALYSCGDGQVALDTVSGNIKGMLILYGLIEITHDITTLELTLKDGSSIVAPHNAANKNTVNSQDNSGLHICASNCSQLLQCDTFDYFVYL